MALAKKQYKVKSPEEKKLEKQQLMDNMFKKMETYTKDPVEMKKLLTFMSNFHQYSSRNKFLINAQFNGAIGVGSFDFFKKKGFSVQKGEKGIKIFVPKNVTWFKRGNETVSLSKATKEEKEKIKQGIIRTQTKTSFGIGNVFDISQTDATEADISKLFPNRHATYQVENQEQIEKAFVAVSNQMGIPVQNGKESRIELGVAFGGYAQYFDGDTLKEEIVLNPRNSAGENVRVLAHELSHAYLHSAKRIEEQEKKGNPIIYTTEVKELQAEMTAYVVAHHLGVDTEDTSLPYMAEWTRNGQEIEEKYKTLEEVNEAADYLIKNFDEQYDRLTTTRDLEKETLVKENAEIKVFGEEDYINEYRNTVIKQAQNDSFKAESMPFSETMMKFEDGEEPVKLHEIQLKTLNDLQSDFRFNNDERKHIHQLYQELQEKGVQSESKQSPSFKHASNLYKKSTTSIKR